MMPGKKTQKNREPETGGKRDEGVLSVRSFRVQAEEWDDEEGSFPAVISTDQPVRIWDWTTGEVVDEILLSKAAVIPKSGQVPLLDTHLRYSVKENQVGSVREIKAGEHELNAMLFVSAAEMEVRTKIAEGHVTDCSVGYFVRTKVRIEPGETAKVKGTSYTAAEVALHVATKWDLRETSICPIGADGDAKIGRSAADPEVIRQLLALTLDKEGKMEEETRTEEGSGQEPGTQEPAAKANAAAQEPEKKREAEQARKAAIIDLAPPGYEKVAERAIIDGKTVEEARAMMRAELEERSKPAGTPPAPPAQSTREEKESTELKEIGDEDFARAISG